MEKRDEKWKKRIVNFVDSKNVLNVRKLKTPQSMWCVPSGSLLHKHQVEVSKIYMQNDGKEENIVFAICPIHGESIRVKLVEPKKP